MHSYCSIVYNALKIDFTAVYSRNDISISQYCIKSLYSHIRRIYGGIAYNSSNSRFTAVYAAMHSSISQYTIKGHKSENTRLHDNILYCIIPWKYDKLKHGIVLDCFRLD